VDISGLGADQAIGGLAGASSPTLGISAGSITPAFVVKNVVSLVLSLLGMYYLALGKKEGDGGKMVKGAAMLLASLFIFL
jgi:hypothetical protein